MGELEGLELKELPDSQYEAGIRWGDWLARHPDTKVLYCEHCMPRRTP